MTWENALEIAENGITEAEKDITVYFDEEGEERSQLPQGTGKGNGGKQRRPRTPPRDRSRSRRDRNNSGGRANAIQRWQSQHALGSNMPIRISRMELAELIDGVNRAAIAASHCANFCEKAVTSFRAEAEAMQACKFMLERFRRA